MVIIQVKACIWLSNKVPPQYLLYGIKKVQMKVFLSIDLTIKTKQQWKPLKVKLSVLLVELDVCALAQS